MENLDRPFMDNNRLILVSATITDFRLGMQLAFRHVPGDLAYSWWEWTPARPDYRGCPLLVLSWENVNIIHQVILLSTNTDFR